MEYSIGSAGSELIGLYTMEVQLNDGATTLTMEKDVLSAIGMDVDSDPATTYEEWFKAVHPLYRDSVRSAIVSCIGGLQAEVRILWEHKAIGLTCVAITGVLIEKDDARAVIKGFFKLTPYTEENSIDFLKKDTAVYKLMLSDVIMNSYAVCALLDIKTNRILFLRDKYFPEVENNNLTYDEWREFGLSVLFRDDADKYRRYTAREAMPGIFDKNDNEFQIELRFLNPQTKRYQRLKERFLRFKNPIAGQYGECMLFSEIEMDHGESFREMMRRRLIDGLALPYRELDLVNLQTGRFYSSKSRQGEYTEQFTDCGSFDEAIISYFDNCELASHERAECMDKFSVKKMVQRFMAGEKLIEAELRHKREDGLLEWVRLQAFQSAADEERAPYMAIVTAMPINEEKERQIHEKQVLEKALRSERQFRKAVQSNMMAVYTYNLSKDIMYEEIVESENSRSLLPDLGLAVPCSYNAYIERKAELLNVAEDKERFKKLFNTVTLLDMFNSKRYTVDMEYGFTAVDGRSGFFRETVIMTKDLETGDIWGLTTIRSITEEYNENKRIALALKEAFNQAQSANNAKTVFMSQMSHDIRTPLNSILGMTEIAREYADSPARVQECLDKIEYAGHHLLEIINNVLDLSAIESGKTVLTEENFSLSAFLDDMLKMFVPLTENRGISLNRDIERMHDSVIGDETRLRQLLVNILSNAVKYSNEGGSIDFSARELEPDRHDVCRYMFIVTDDGIGMSEEFKKKMFDPFTRADVRRTGNAQGTGLGMSIALHLARMMNGDITVSSEEGKGTIVEVTVCLKRGEDSDKLLAGSTGSAKPKKVRMSDYDFGGRKVLLAEDLSFNAEIAAEFLSAADLYVDIASNGAEAVRMFADSKTDEYSIIFMDIQMPELDGYGAAKQIRALERPDAQTVPILAMTANAFLEDIREAERAGMNGHIAKPLEIPKLAEALVKFLGDCRRKAD